MSDITEHPDHPLFLDHGRPYIISAFGRKGSGKSVFNRLIYRSYPGDKIAIDINGHAEPGPDAERITKPLPSAFPTPVAMPGERRKPRNLHYVADPGSDTYTDDIDRAVGLALFPKDHPCMLWAGEVGELMPNGRPGPHMRRILQQNRHHRVTALFDGPRPVWVDKSLLIQSDLIALYELPDPDDQKRIAQCIGWKPADFQRQCEDTWARGDHWFLLWDAKGKRLWRQAPLPIEDADTVGVPA